MAWRHGTFRQQPQHFGAPSLGNFDGVQLFRPSAGQNRTVQLRSKTSTAALVDRQHRMLPPSDPVVIEDHVWIGSRVCILPGVRIGHHSAVGAGSVVTKDIPAHCLAAGNPARVADDVALTTSRGLALCSVVSLARCPGRKQGDRGMKRLADTPANSQRPRSRRWRRVAGWIWRRLCHRL
jgi:hypothetical protein